MSYENWPELVAEIKAATGGIKEGDHKFRQRLDGFEQSLNELYKKVGRPGHEVVDDTITERKDAIARCRNWHDLQTPKDTGGAIYSPDQAAINNAKLATKSMRALLSAR